MPRPTRIKGVSRRTSAARVPTSLAEKHLGVIYARCLHYYRHLPVYVRNFYDVDDFAEEVILHVHRRSGRYDPTRAKEVTWVYWVADNYCKTRLSHLTRKRRFNEPTEITPGVSRRLSAESHLERREARDGVEKVIARSSEAALELLSQILNGLAPKGLVRRCGLKDGRWAFSGLTEEEESAIRDLQRSAQICGVSFSDIMLTLQYSVS